MKKLSVIIPTIYKKPLILYKIIELLEKEDVVDEIILISNAECKMSFPYTEKLKAFEPETNAFVCLSWNFAVSTMQNEYFLIMNDDILFPTKFCEKVLNSEILDKEDTGLIGLDVDFINNYDKNMTDDISIPIVEGNMKLEFKPLDKYLKTGDWASAFFGKKENYHVIPDIFNIIYGDNYLLYQNLMRGKINYSVSGVNFNHVHSSSSASKEFSEIIKNDHLGWAWYTINYINQNKF